MPRLNEPAKKGISVGSGFGWGMTLGGVQRLNATVAGALEFVGAIGGAVGAITLPEGWSDVCEGVGAGSGALIGLGLTAPTPTTTAGRTTQPKNGVERLMLKEASAAKNMAAAGVGAHALAI